MDFYTSIARYYDYIFPLNHQQVKFVEYNCKLDQKLKVLDVGCASGSLAIALVKNNYSITGIDLNDALIALANAKKGHLSVSFEKINMLELNLHFTQPEFDRVICFGNTLVHLQNESQIQSFVNQAYAILKPGGLFQIQIINYDRILDEGIKGLPTIDNEHVNFIRQYHFNNSQSLIEFSTKLTIKSLNQELVNTEFLLPIRQLNLLRIINDTGFSAVRTFGSFDRKPHQQTDIPLIFEAIK